MNNWKVFILFVFLTILLFSCSSHRDNRNSFVLIRTTFGDITVKLYDETPVHRDNFLKLTDDHLLEGVTFHRVIKDFMIQSGDPETKPDYRKVSNDTLISYTLPAEFNPALYHKKGALAAAREGNDINPEMRSSGTQFYIVQGKKYTDEELDLSVQKVNNGIKQALFTRLLKQISDSCRGAGSTLKDSEIQEKATLRMFDILDKKGEFRLSADQRSVYKNSGGVQRLDGTYTVFGEVVRGLDVVDRIAATQTDNKDKPLTDIRIVKMKRVSR